MYLPIDYNCFVNQLYHKTKIICKKRVTSRKSLTTLISHYKYIYTPVQQGHYGHITGLTKPAKVGKILDLYRLKSFSLDCKAKVTLFLFASHSFLANNLRFMVKLIAIISYK
jgi:hypothetical protein